MLIRYAKNPRGRDINVYITSSTAFSFDRSEFFKDLISASASPNSLSLSVNTTHNIPSPLRSLFKIIADTKNGEFFLIKNNLRF
jgi:hypothetical protein